MSPCQIRKGASRIFWLDRMLANPRPKPTPCSPRMRLGKQPQTRNHRLEGVQRRNHLTKIWDAPRFQEPPSHISAIMLHSAAVSRLATRFGAVGSHEFRVDECLRPRAGFRKCARQSRRSCRRRHVMRNSVATGVCVAQAYRTSAGMRPDFVLKSRRPASTNQSWPMHHRWNCLHQAAWIPRPRRHLANSSRRRLTAESRRQSERQ